MTIPLFQRMKLGFSRFTHALAAILQRLKIGFRHFAHALAAATGSPLAFLLSLLLILIWSFSRPLFKSFDSWQMVINTGTTIITFLMVFLLQNVQNRDAKAIQLKLDELIRAVKPARNKLLLLEELSDEEMEQLHKEFLKLRAKEEDVVKEKSLPEITS